MMLGISKRRRGDHKPDPTENVLGYVDAAVQRQDDLRMQQSRHIRQLMKMRSKHADGMRVAEAARINAIRSVDVTAVQQAASVADMRANTLAAQVGTSAEALRTQVQDAATAAAIALTAALSPIQTDVADLRKTQYEQQGSKAHSVEEREVLGGQAPWIMLGVAIAGVVGAVIVSQIGQLRRSAAIAVGQRERVVETRAVSNSRSGWAIVAVAIAAMFASVVLGIAALGVTLILHG
jgi:hypothetical protein